MALNEGRQAIWPNGAAAAFALGFDMDGETIWRNKARSLPQGTQYLKGPSIGGYGPRRGALHILDILDRYGLRATWFVPADMIREHPATVERILCRGHEIAYHGMDHSGACGDTCEQQLAHMARCQEIFVRYTGVKAAGIRRTGSFLPETERYLYGAGGFRYCSDSARGEAFGWYTVEGRRTEAVHIPCLSEQMDDYVQTVYHSYPAVLAGMPRIAPYDCVYSDWMHEISGAVRFGASGASAFHPQISGAPGRAVILEKLCAYLSGSTEIWCATCAEIAERYRKVMGGPDEA